MRRACVASCAIALFLLYRSSAMSAPLFTKIKVHRSSSFRLLELMRQIAVVLLLAGVVQAQGQAPRSFVGTIAGFRPEKAQIEIRPDNGDPVIAEISPESTALKVAPGTRDLKGAEAIPITDVTVGDRAVGVAVLQPEGDV